MGAAGFIYYKNLQTSYRQRAASEISAVANLKVQQIQLWRAERFFDAQMILNDPFLMRALCEMLDSSPPDESVQDNLRLWMQALREKGGYRDILLVDAQGKTRLYEGEHEASLKPYGIKQVKQALQSRTILLSDFHQTPTIEGVHLDLVVPLLVPAGPQEKNNCQGAVFLRMNPAAFITPLLNTWPGATPSAETLLVRKEGQEVLYLTPLRREANAAPLTVRRSLSLTNLPEAMAARGLRGAVEGTDYSGHPVLASLNAVSGTPWLLIAKVDSADILAPLYFRGRMIAAFFGGLILLFGMSLLIWWSRQKARFFRKQFENERDRRALVQHFEYLTRYANDIILLVNADLQIVEANERALQTYGYPVEELIGMPMARLRPQERREDFIQRIRQAETRDGLVYETLHQSQEGRIFPVEVSLRVLMIDGKKYYQGIFREITERKQAEQRIVNLSRMYLLLSQINQCIVRGRHRAQLFDDIVRTSVECGQFQLAWIGLVDQASPQLIPSSVCGKGAEFVRTLRIPLDVVPKGMGPSARAVREQATVICNEALSDPGMKAWQNEIGRLGVRSMASVPLFFEGRVLGVYSVCSAEPGFFDENEVQLLKEIGEDLAFALDMLNREQQRQEAQDKLNDAYHTLQMNEVKYRTLFESANDGILLLENGRFVDCNQYAEALFGRARSDLLGRSPAGLSPAQQPNGRSSEEWAEELVQAALGGHPQHFEWTHLHPDSTLLHVEATLNAVAIDGRPCVQVVLRDIRDRLRAEAEREQLHRSLFQAQKMEAVGKLAGGVAHDFNNILTVIKGNAELLDSTVPPDAEDCLREIQKAAERAKGLTRQLMAFSRKQALDPQVLRINQLVESMQKMLIRLIGEDVALALELAPDLPSVKVDPGQVEQVIMNLVINARDAMPDGGRITVQTASRVLAPEDVHHIKDAREGAFVSIRVRDTGVGMPASILDQIFEPFFTTKDRDKGTGLGLAVVYGIVRQHNGFVTVESAPGQGAQFEVFLPVCDEAARQEEARIHSVKADRGKGERILVVEDEKNLRVLAVRMLTEQGYEVLAADSAEEAVQVFEKERGRVDLLFVDVIMTGESGVKLVERLRSVHPSLPVLLTSGYSDEKAHSDELAAQNLPLLNKPYDLNTLFHRIREILDRARSGP